MLIKAINLLLLSVVFLSFESCSQGTSNQFKNSVSSLPYDLDHPQIINLPSGLNEISGIVYSAKDKSLFAIEDEDGILYQITLSKPVQVKQWQFGKHGDYEDVTLVDNTFYVLESNGNIVSFNLSPSINSDKTKFPEKNGYEFESLYFDPAFKQLVMICKDCRDDNKKAVSAWGFNPSTKKYTPSLFTIKTSPVADKLNEDKVHFKPSAAAFHPITHELYILSSVNQVLAVASNNGNIKTVYKLNTLFKQPESIAFLPTGDMIISNESHNTGTANLLVFKYR